MRRRLPYADLSRFEQDPTVNHLGDLFTVDLIVRFIRGKLSSDAA